MMIIGQESSLGYKSIKVCSRPGGKTALTEQKLYIGNVVITKRSNSTSDEFYLHKDYQGSTTTVTNSAGAVVQQFIYDPWGKQTATFTSGLLASYIAPAATKGYTGHEEISHLNLIHMNGRIYDATIGRFMQADPFIQEPSNSQNYNRYSYVLNNPMSMTDPSGYFFKWLNKKLGKFAPFVGIAMMFIPGFQAWAVASFQNAFISGFLIGGVSTGSLKGALIGGFTAMAFKGIGDHFRGKFGVDEFVDASASQQLQWAGAHAVTGGVINVLQGGKFGHGFISAGITKYSGSYIGANFDDETLDGLIGGTIGSAVVGGTVSAITGGKFANGARTGVFQHMYNAGGKWAAKLARRLWTITPHGTKAALKAKDGRKYYQSIKDGTWWSRDTAGHGGASWKVFDKQSDGLHWRADADEYGNYITGKHKSDAGMFIPNKSLSVTDIPNQAITNTIIVTVTVLEITDPLTYITSGNNYEPPPSNEEK